MRGADRQTAAMFTYASPESLVPKDHPLRAIRPLVNAALERLSGAFDKLYSPFGRDSIAPEKLMRALLLQAFFSIRSERQLMEQVTYNMIFRWFVGLAMDAPVWDVTVSTKNRDRLLEGDIARAFLVAILSDPQVVPLLSNEHFSVDGTLIQAWDSMKSFKPKDGSGEPPAGGRGRTRRVALLVPDLRQQCHRRIESTATTRHNLLGPASWRSDHRRRSFASSTLPPWASAGGIPCAAAIPGVAPASAGRLPASRHLFPCPSS